MKISKRNNNISVAEPFIYDVQATGEKPLNNRPVVVGSGPAGLFCALLLAEKGYRPIILERGKTVKERVKDVEKFWKEIFLIPRAYGWEKLILSLCIKEILFLWKSKQEGKREQKLSCPKQTSIDKNYISSIRSHRSI